MDKWGFLSELLKSPVSVAIISLYFVSRLLTPVVDSLPLIVTKLDQVILKLEDCTARPSKLAAVPVRK